VSAHSVIPRNVGHFEVPANTYIIPLAKRCHSMKATNNNDSLFKNPSALKNLLRSNVPIYGPGMFLQNVPLFLKNSAKGGRPRHVMGVLPLPIAESVSMAHMNNKVNYRFVPGLYNGNFSMLSNLVKKGGAGIYIGSYCRSIPGLKFKNGAVTVNGHNLSSNEVTRRKMLRNMNSQLRGGPTKVGAIISAYLNAISNNKSATRTRN
jgi:hypothetical protein